MATGDIQGFISSDGVNWTGIRIRSAMFDVEPEPEPATEPDSRLNILMHPGLLFGTFTVLPRDVLEFVLLADDFVNRVNAINGHGRLLLEEAFALAASSPYPDAIRDAIALIYAREVAIGFESDLERIARLMAGPFGDVARAFTDIAAAFGEMVGDGFAEGAKPDLEEGYSPEWQEAKRAAIDGMTTYPIRAACDPEYHRSRAWRDRYGLMFYRHESRYPLHRARGFARRK